MYVETLRAFPIILFLSGILMLKTFEVKSHDIQACIFTSITTHTYFLKELLNYLFEST